MSSVYILIPYLILCSPFLLYLIGYVVAKLILRSRRMAEPAPLPAAKPIIDAAWPAVPAQAAPAPKTGLRFFDGLACFALAMVVLLTLGSSLQYGAGLWGMILSELLLLAVPLAWALVTRTKLREAFSLRGAPIAKLLGAAVLWFGSMMGIALLNSLLMQLLPQLFVTLDSLNEFMYSGTPLLGFFAIVVAPALCEESLHRGLILYSGRYFNNKTLLVVVMGLVFGVFHMDPARFASTALLGMAFSYAAIETKSILAPVLMHFLNNLYAWGVPLLMSGMVDEAAQHSAAAAVGDVMMRLSTLISYAMLFVIAIAGITVGKLLLGGAGHKVMSKPLIAILAALLIVTLVLGVVTLVAPVNGADATLFETNAEFIMLMDDNENTFTVQASGTMTVMLDAKAETGLLGFTISDPQGNIVYSALTRTINDTRSFPVEPGTYSYSVYTFTQPGERGFAGNGYYKFKAVFSGE